MPVPRRSQRSCWPGEYWALIGPPVRRNVVGMSERLVELAITEVRAAVPLRLGQEAGLAVLSETAEPFRSLHIYIGQAEARAIQAAQRRPATAAFHLGPFLVRRGAARRKLYQSGY